MTMETRIEEAITAIDYVSVQKNIDPDKIGLVGWSQGGFVTAVAAGRTASSGKVKSIALWAPSTNQLYQYSKLFGRDKLSEGLTLGENEALEFTVPWGVTNSLKKGFFEDVWTLNPVAESMAFKKPMLVVMGSKDDIAPPKLGSSYIRYHNGIKEMHIINSGHVWGAFTGSPAILDDLALRTAAWFSSTLN